VVTLTKQGLRLAMRLAGLLLNRSSTTGLSSHGKAEHDTQIYRAYLKRQNKYRAGWGQNLFALSSILSSSETSTSNVRCSESEPERDIAEIKQEVAQRFNLPYIDSKIEIPGRSYSLRT